LLLAIAAIAQRADTPRVDSLEGLWQGFDGEWGHVSRQLIALAETIPEDKYSWRPGAGVRSTSEVIMHLAISNFFLLSVTGPPMPNDLTSNQLEKSITRKTDVISWLRRSLEAVKMGRARLKPGELARRVKIEGRDATVDGMYLRIIVHANEHMGQLIAYARVNGIAHRGRAVIVWPHRARTLKLLANPPAPRVRVGSRATFPLTD
jgi:uncharacterized damage-inducible protein DinB